MVWYTNTHICTNSHIFVYVCIYTVGLYICVLYGNILHIQYMNIYICIHTVPTVLQQVPGSFLLTADCRCPWPRHAARSAESPAAWPVPESHHRVGLGWPQQTPSPHRSPRGSAYRGSPVVAAVSPGHAPAQGAHGAPELTPGSQGVHLQPPSV